MNGPNPQCSKPEHDKAIKAKPLIDIFLKQEMNESSDYNRSARQLSELAAAFPVRSPAAGNPENPQTNS